MTRGKKQLIVALMSALFVGSGIAAQYFGGARARRAHAVEDVLPEFKDLPPGPRAPKAVGFDVVVGKTTLSEVEESASSRSIHCRDTSARALIRAARAKKQQEVQLEVDATTGASGKGGSAMERNPQVRLSCEGTASETIGDRPRPHAVGRLLYIFDSASHPLRHVSYRRVHTDHALARTDVHDALAAMKAIYGEPTATSGALPAEGADFAKFEPFKAEWSWTDVKVTVTALSYGDRGVDVYEAVEVPWPIRSDAPQISR